MHIGGMHSPSRLEAILQTIWLWLRSFRPRPPVLTESDLGWQRRTMANVALRASKTREQLKHEYGFDDDN